MSKVRSKLERNFTYFGKGLHEVRSEVTRTSVDVCMKFDGNSFKVRRKFARSFFAKFASKW